MNTEMGEYLVGAYLRLIKNSDFVEYNIWCLGNKLAGLNDVEKDVQLSKIK